MGDAASARWRLKLMQRTASKKSKTMKDARSFFTPHRRTQ
jgi:hypothetical protein